MWQFENYFHIYAEEELLKCDENLFHRFHIYGKYELEVILRSIKVVFLKDNFKFQLKLFFKNTSFKLIFLIIINLKIFFWLSYFKNNF